jgi:hypothetical protein
MKGRGMFVAVVLTLIMVMGGGAPQMIDAGPLPGGGQSYEVAAAPGSARITALAGNAFTYQGYLTDGGVPANGLYDFSFSLYADPVGTQWIADALSVNNAQVTNGLFTVPVDLTDGMYGDVYFYLNGEARYLRIGVRPGASSGSYTWLTPLQPLTPAPYALALPGMNTVQNDTSANVLGGYSWNYASPSIVGATVGGGGHEGGRNEVQGNYATVGGGASNVASGEYATIPGGQSNAASGDYSFAAGYRAKASHNGSFVWADYTAADLNSTTSNQFRVRATNGAEFYANAVSYGVWLQNQSTTGDGVRAYGSVSNGNSYAALYAYNSGSSPAVYANTSSGTYSGYFADPIYVNGGCVGCALVYIARNDGAKPLEVGDVVGATGVEDPLVGSASPVLCVRLAGDGLGVAGVVLGRAEVSSETKDGQALESASQAAGPAAPGDYLFLVVQGIAQVKVDASAGPIASGARLAAADRSGHARALRSRILDGMEVVEGAPLVGIALEPLESGTGLIPVLVTLR